MSEGSSIAVVVLNWNGVSDTLQCLSSLRRSVVPLHAIVVDVWRPGGSVPQSYWETQQRINEFLYADKTRYDESASRRVNRYVELVWELHRLVETAHGHPAGAEQGIC